MNTNMPFFLMLLMTLMSSLSYSQEFIWNDKKDVLVVNYSSDVGLESKVVLYVENDSIKTMSLHEIYVDNSIKAMNLMLLGEFIELFSSSAIDYEAHIVRNNDKHYIAGFKVKNTRYQDKPQIVVKIGFSDAFGSTELFFDKDLYIQNTKYYYSGIE